MRLIGQGIGNLLKRLLLRNYLAMYHAGWGRPGDVGFVAEVEGVRVGAFWYRLFTDEKHGDGFVDEQTPELVIAVVDGHRGRGAGTALLQEIADRARRAGLTRVALSVNHDNPAKELYLRAGYRDYHPEDGKDRMVLEL